MQRNFFIILAVITAIAIYGPPAFAGSSPWLPSPGGGSITVSYVSQGATEFYRSTVKGPTPGGAPISLNKPCGWMGFTVFLIPSLWTFG